MPGLDNLLDSTSLAMYHVPRFKEALSVTSNTTFSLSGGGFKTVAKNENSNGKEHRVLMEHPWELKRCMTVSRNKCLDIKTSAPDMIKFGTPQRRCIRPFLNSDLRLVECLFCRKFVYPGEGTSCSVHDCEGVYHLICAEKWCQFSNSRKLQKKRKFKCPQHTCFNCKKERVHWRCVLCTMASHHQCDAFPEKIKFLPSKKTCRRAICWIHHPDWRLEKKITCSLCGKDVLWMPTGLIYLLNDQCAAPVSYIEDVFCCLPLPYFAEEFTINLLWKRRLDNCLEPPPYVHIKRNVYLVKKKRVASDIGCRNCSSICSADCVCRVQSISCSKSCHCYDSCSNRPFRKDKKIKIVKTRFCGWGVEAAESINKGDFIVEYIGEVIDDSLCEQRLWDMKYEGIKNFYMCEVGKDFTIDASLKGNYSRFLNHSCDPNCHLEKWQVEGETRVGVFAARSIHVGEALKYDYRFVGFGEEIKCRCGASNCQGYLGSSKRKAVMFMVSWGSKRRRARHDL